jgi:glyoxylate utilization-related uncharacterized protein
VRPKAGVSHAGNQSIANGVRGIVALDLAHVFDFAIVAHQGRQAFDQFAAIVGDHPVVAFEQLIHPRRKIVLEKFAIGNDARAVGEGIAPVDVVVAGNTDVPVDGAARMRTGGGFVKQSEQPGMTATNQQAQRAAD